MLTLAIPLLKLVPRACQWRIRRGINRWYLALQMLETSILVAERRERLQEILDEIGRIDEETARAWQMAPASSSGDEIWKAGRGGREGFGLRNAECGMGDESDSRIAGRAGPPRGATHCAHPRL